MFPALMLTLAALPTLRGTVLESDHVVVARVTDVHIAPRARVATIDIERVLSGSPSQAMTVSENDGWHLRHQFDRETRWVLFLKASHDGLADASVVRRIPLEGGTFLWPDGLRPLDRHTEKLTTIEQLSTEIARAARRTAAATFREVSFECERCEVDQFVPRILGGTRCGDEACATDALKQHRPFMWRHDVRGIHGWLDVATFSVDGSTVRSVIESLCFVNSCGAGVVIARCPDVACGKGATYENPCARNAADVERLSERRAVSSLRCSEFDGVRYAGCAVDGTGTIAPSPDGPDLLCEERYADVLQCIADDPP